LGTGGLLSILKPALNYPASTYFGAALDFTDGKAMPPDGWELSGMVSIILAALLYIAPDTLPLEAVILSP
jgi:hypothetical protein